MLTRRQMPKENSTMDSTIVCGWSPSSLNTESYFGTGNSIVGVSSWHHPEFAMRHKSIGKPMMLHLPYWETSALSCQSVSIDWNWWQKLLVLLCFFVFTFLLLSCCMHFFFFFFLLSVFCRQINKNEALFFHVTCLCRLPVSVCDLWLQHL